MNACDFFLHLQNAQNNYKLGLKYNEIVDDICYLYNDYISNLEYVPSEGEFYSFLFDPCINFKQHSESHPHIYHLLTQAKFDIFFIFLKKAFEDPPAFWWKEQQIFLNAHKPT
jgi:hypothetical protein